MTPSGAEKPQKRVAVIGTGLAGLTTGYLLAKQGCHVCLLEKSTSLGFHSSSLEIPASGMRAEGSSPSQSKQARKKNAQSSWRLDVPMRSFQGGYYPQLLALYRHLNIPVVASDFTFAFSTLPAGKDTPSDPHFIHAGASGLSLPSFPARSYQNLAGMIKALATFVLFAVCYIILLILAFLSHHNLLLGYDNLSLSDIRLSRAGDFFVEIVLIPLFSAVGTMSRDDVRATRIATILSYIHLTVGTSHYRVHDSVGARGVAEILTQPVQSVMLGVAITGMKMSDGCITLQVEGRDDVVVDDVVVATPAGAARSLMAMYSAALRRNADKERQSSRVLQIQAGLRLVQYRETIVVTHRDSSVLPTNPADVRDINLIQPAPFTVEESHSQSSSRSSSPTLLTPKDSSFAGPAPYFAPSLQYTMATHIMRPPPSFVEVGPVYQTTNPCMPIREEVLAVARLERALPLSDPTRTLQLLHPAAASGTSPSIHVVGSYAYSGIPLLEGCVGSARKAAEAIAPGSTLVDWSAGEEGGIIGRAWRWRWRARS